LIDLVPESYDLRSISGLALSLTTCFSHKGCGAKSLVKMAEERTLAIIAASRKFRGFSRIGSRESPHCGVPSSQSIMNRSKKVSVAIK
jgi:hypothetical protein